jgi:Arc/MetJ family transcription regulator
MRTTVNIDEHLLQQARELAARSRRSLGDVVDDALRILLAERRGERSDVDLPVFGGSGLQPGVDLEDKASLAALLGDDGPVHAPR